MYFIPVPSHSRSDIELSVISLSLLAFSGDDYKHKFPHVYPGTHIGLGKGGPWLRFFMASDWQGGMVMEWGTKQTSFSSFMGILWGEIQWRPLSFYAMKMEKKEWEKEVAVWKVKTLGSLIFSKDLKSNEFLYIQKLESENGLGWREP